eukprot:Nk52_evm10s1763 gene=Nk52_evmTU10s1763
MEVQMAGMEGEGRGENLPPYRLGGVEGEGVRGKIEKMDSKFEMAVLEAKEAREKVKNTPMAPVLNGGANEECKEESILTGRGAKSRRRDERDEEEQEVEEKDDKTRYRVSSSLNNSSEESLDSKKEESLDSGMMAKLSKISKAKLIEYVTTLARQNSLLQAKIAVMDEENRGAPPSGMVRFRDICVDCKKRLRVASKKLRRRRTFAELKRTFKCPVEGCSKYYASDGALSQHISIKHGAIPRKLSKTLDRLSVSSSAMGQERVPCLKGALYDVSPESTQVFNMENSTTAPLAPDNSITYASGDYLGPTNNFQPKSYTGMDQNLSASSSYEFHPLRRNSEPVPASSKYDKTFSESAVFEEEDYCLEISAPASHGIESGSSSLFASPVKGGIPVTNFHNTIDLDFYPQSKANPLLRSSFENLSLSK